MLAAWALVAFCARRLAGVSWTIAACSILFAAMMSVSLGQIAPLAIAAVTAAALLLELRRFAPAGCIAALAMVEPHVALPACLAMFVAFPRVRTGMLLTGIAMLLLSAAFGVERNAEYIGAVLPAHALSDVADVGQFSATVLAHVAGFADRIAVRIGTIWYAAACIAGIVTALALRKRTGRDAMVALIPMTFAVFGGAYVHWQQVVAAIPALLVLGSLRKSGSPIFAAVLAGLAIPWLYVVGWAFLIPGAVAVAALLVYQIVRSSGARRKRHRCRPLSRVGPLHSCLGKRYAATAVRCEHRAQRMGGRVVGRLRSRANSDGERDVRMAARSDVARAGCNARR